MEKSFNVHISHPSRFRLRKESERKATAPLRGQRQRAVKAGQLSEASSVKKERVQKQKPGMNKVKVAQDTELRLNSTVVDIDSVRDDKIKNENLGVLEAADEEEGLKRKNLGIFEWLLMIFILALVLLFLPLSIWFCVKVVREHERAVIFRLGHLLRGRPRGPGLLLYLPLLDVCRKVDIRLKMLKVPPHMVVTRDLKRPELGVMCYYQIENVALCITTVSSLTIVLQTLVRATVRDVLAQHTLSHILLHRRRLSQHIQATADSVACHWGIRVDRVDIDELNFPTELERSLTVEAKFVNQQHVRVKAADEETTAWELLRASLHHLHPTLVLQIPPDLLSLNSDQSSLPPPPAVEEEGMTKEETENDSPMM